MTDIERCDQEIAEADAMLRAGHPDVAGLLQQLMDWSIERRLLCGTATDQVSGNNWTEATWA